VRNLESCSQDIGVEVAGVGIVELLGKRRAGYIDD